MLTSSNEVAVKAEQNSIFTNRQTKVILTAQRLELKKDNAVIIGGAGLALYGLNSRLDNRIGLPFDLDAFISKDKLSVLKKRHRVIRQVISAANPNMFFLPRPIVPLPFTGSVYGFSFFGDEDYYDGFVPASKDSIEISGLPTLPPHILAEMKLKSGRPKDIAGLIQAHVLGFEDENSHVLTREWRATIDKAVCKVADKSIKPNTFDLRVPSWLAEIAMSYFQHEAFQSL